MRYKLLVALVFISCAVQAQQVNPVPDYVFQNRMSVGRTTVTDTLAYFSMGPRYGAIRGFMPPMVVDTTLVTGGTKRNGLTIFSMQRNRYTYWDSAASRWREFGPGTITSITAGTGLTGGTITTSGTIAADTLTLSTRAWRQKGIDSVAGLARVTGSGTTNYVPKFTSSTALGNSLIFDDGTNIGIGTASPTYKLSVNGNLSASYIATSSTIASALINTGNGAGLIVQNGSDGTTNTIMARFRDNTSVGHEYQIRTIAGQIIHQATWLNSPGANMAHLWITANSSGAATEKMRLTHDGELYVGQSGTPTDAGAYALQVSGAIYNTTTITTGAPTSGTAKPWRLGEAATVSPTSPNRTIRVEIDGTVYYIHAKTTND